MLQKKKYSLLQSPPPFYYLKKKKTKNMFWAKCYFPSLSGENKDFNEFTLMFFE